MTPSSTMLFPLLALALKLLIRLTYCYDERPNCAAYSQDIRYAVSELQPLLVDFVGPPSRTRYIQSPTSSFPRNEFCGRRSVWASRKLIPYVNSECTSFPLKLSCIIHEQLV